MSGAIDLVSPERLQRIRELAEKATPGPWGTDEKGRGVYTHAAVSEDRTFGYGCGYRFICDLNGGEYHEYENAEEQLNTAAHISANYPGAVMVYIDEILRLRKQVALLNKEADWLAEHMPKTSMIDGKAKVQCLRGMQEWRETARKAVEENDARNNF